MIRAALLVITLGLVSCRSSLPVPPTGPHVGSAIEVPYPPPPARVEIIKDPPQKDTEMVWIDGEWEWRGRRWVWQIGEWQLPQPGAYYAPATTVRLSTGKLVWYPGSWELDKESK